MVPVKQALVSVSDKSGIVDFCKGLGALNIEILSTGGTAQLLAENGISVKEVSAYTHFPEIMDGRVKTLHPKIHGGILGRYGTDDTVMQAHNIDSIELVVVNLYPFEQVISAADYTFTEAIENIDIGGPALLRSAAKNHDKVAAVVSSSDYAAVLTELTENNCSISGDTRFRLAQKVFAYTANYDANIANFLGALNQAKEPVAYPLTYSFQFNRQQELRYGENPHQTAALYSEANAMSGTLATAKKTQGKALSYNNIVDADAALECVLSFTETACVIVKHANPCGVAVADTVLAAYQHAYVTDPQSAFGGIIAFNRQLDAETAQAIIAQQFVEIIIAPQVTSACMHILSTKPDIRLLIVGKRRHSRQQLNMKRVSGGLLVQDQDRGLITNDDLKVVSKRKPTKQQWTDLLFAWQVVKYVKSNAIVYAQHQQTVGIGAGQTSRVYSARIAALKADQENLALEGAVMASDAFLPFADSLDVAVAAGITAVIQPGGSKRDSKVIAAADNYGIPMIFTGMRHFLH